MAQEIPGEKDRELFRVRHQVRPVTSEEEGTGVSRLPDGVYGFTSMPLLRDFPLFQSYKLFAFEVHKTSDQGPVLIGWVSEELALRMTTEDSLDMKVYPEPQDHAPIALAIPFSRITRIGEYSARQDGAVELTQSRPRPAPQSTCPAPR